MIIRGASISLLIAPINIQDFFLLGSILLQTLTIYGTAREGRGPSFYSPLPLLAAHEHPDI